MAYLETRPDEEEDERAPGSDLDLFADGGGTLDPSTGGAGAPAGAAPGGAAPFADVGAFLSANQPATQQLGSRVAGEIRGRGDTARGAIEQGLGAFNADVGGREVQQDVGLLNQLTADPSGLAADPERRAAFERQRDAQYGGPGQLEDTDHYTPISKAVGEAKRYGELSQSGGGLAEILAGSQQSRPYSRGALEFDAGLLQSDPTSRSEIEGARGSLGDIDARLGQASGAARTRATQAAETTAGTREATRGALGGAYSSHEADLDRRLGEARTEATRRAGAARSALGGLQTTVFQAGEREAPGKSYLGRYGLAPGTEGGLTPEQRARIDPAARFQSGTTRYGVAGPDASGFNDEVLGDLGIDQAFVDELVSPELSKRGTQSSQGKRIDATYGAGLGDLTRYLTEQSPDAQITRANTASADDYARLGALNELSGEQRGYLDPALADQAGTADLDLVDLDLGGIENARELAREIAERERARSQGVNARSSSSGTFAKKYGSGTVAGRVAGARG